MQTVIITNTKNSKVQHKCALSWRLWLLPIINWKHICAVLELFLNFSFFAAGDFLRRMNASQFSSNVFFNWTLLET